VRDIDDVGVRERREHVEQERSAIPIGRRGAMMREVGRPRTACDQQDRALRDSLLSQQHAPNVIMRDDGHLR
jgi:hypothetical protein